MQIQFSVCWRNPSTLCKAIQKLAASMGIYTYKSKRYMYCVYSNVFWKGGFRFHLYIYESVIFAIYVSLYSIFLRQHGRKPYLNIGEMLCCYNTQYFLCLHKNHYYIQCKSIKLVTI